MRSIRILLPLLLVSVLGACGGGASDEAAGDETGAMQSAPPAGASEEPALPEIEDGVQVVHVEAGETGFTPESIQLRPGMPARLVFTRTVESDCLAQVHSPDLGIEKTDLPMDEPVEIAFTPPDGGSFTFACGMDMVTGTIVVRS